MKYTNKIKQNYYRFKNNYHNLPHTIHEAYDRPSDTKISIFNYWLNKVRELGGHTLRITGHNCFHFSLGFIYYDNGTEYFAFITPQNDYYCKVKELEV